MTTLEAYKELKKLYPLLKQYSTFKRERENGPPEYIIKFKLLSMDMFEDPLVFKGSSFEETLEKVRGFLNDK